MCCHTLVPKRGCPHKRSSPAWGGQRNMNHCRRRDAQKTQKKKKKWLHISSACVVCCESFCLGVFERCCSPAGDTLEKSCIQHPDVIPATASPHSMPIKPELLILKNVFINYNLKKDYRKIKKGIKPIARLSYSTPLSASYSFFPSFPRRLLFFITPRQSSHQGSDPLGHC